MPSAPALDAPAVAVRLRRLWLGPVLASPELAASDLAGAALDVELRRVGATLHLRTPFDFGAGDPFAGALGDLLRREVAAVSRGAVRELAWEFARELVPVRRPQSSDLDVYAPGDPLLDDYPDLLDRLRARIPPDTSAEARAAVGGLRLVGASRHRLWFATPTEAARDALRTVPHARGALVTAIQALQRHELPLYRVVVDRGYRGRRAFV